MQISLCNTIRVIDRWLLQLRVVVLLVRTSDGPTSEANKTYARGSDVEAKKATCMEAQQRRMLAFGHLAGTWQSVPSRLLVTVVH